MASDNQIMEPLRLLWLAVCIGGRGGPSAAGAAGPHAARGELSGPAPVRGDSVDLRPVTSRAARVAGWIAGPQSRLEALAGAVAAGRYEPDAAVVADALLAEALSDMPPGLP